MGGGLMQLVAYGAQDVYLTGNPQITFFKVVYRRHTNFSMESVKQSANGGSSTYSWTIARSGDLICNMFLEKCKFITAGYDPTASGSGHYLHLGTPTDGQKEMDILLHQQSELDTIRYSLEIGGQVVDKFDNLWRRTYNSLVELNPVFDDQTLLDRMERAGVWNLPFWFCRNPGLALPLIALQYHEVKLIMDLNKAESGTYIKSASDNSIELWVDYVYLDTDERRRFAQVSHEYLIEQVQTYKSSVRDASNSLSLNFNHPVKELVWVHLDSLGVPTQHNANKINSNSSKVKLVLNGQDRFAERVARYFSDLQVNQYHTGCGSLWKGDIDVDFINSGLESTQHSLLAQTFQNNAVRPVYVYSFALKPEEHQPSGTCNFSRIDSANLNFTGLSTDSDVTAYSDKSSSNDAIKLGLFNPSTTVVYAVNYNVLRIMSGMGGLAYSN
jgi:hypothetical protein